MNKYSARDMIVSDRFALLIIAAMLIAGAVAYPNLPARVPSHWNIRGEIDGWSSASWGAFGLPLMAAGIYALLVVLPAADPRRENYGRFAGAYGIIRRAMLFLFGALHATILMNGLGYIVNTGIVVQVAVSLLFIVLGNVMGQLKQNYFVGIKTPWTLADEEVWQKTHRVSAWVWSLAGVVGLVAALLPAPVNFTLMMVAILGAAVFSVVYPYVLFRAKSK